MILLYSHVVRNFRKIPLIGNFLQGATAGSTSHSLYKEKLSRMMSFEVAKTKCLHL